MSYDPEIEAELFRAMETLETLKLSITVDGPPCARCRHWKPTINIHVAILDDGTRYKQITPRLCQSAPNCAFSCFEPKS